jgi:hypothetical protein
MASPVSASAGVPYGRAGALVGRATFVALLAGLVALPHVSNRLEFPAVDNGASLLPFALLMAVPLLDFTRPWRWAHADVIALLLPVVSLVCYRPQRPWAILLIYPAFAYLVVRMVRVARDTTSTPALQAHRSGSWLPLSWLIAGLVILAGVHLDWTLASHTITDAGEGTVRGALRLVDGGQLYGSSNVHHGDTYGPLSYEAYIPFGLIFTSHAAAHISAFFYDLLTAALLFALGYQRRGPRAGVVLAYCWLAFPLTLYSEVFGFTDPLIAAALVATLLASGRPRARGYALAAAGWAKFSPFALLPVMASFHAASGERNRRSLAVFAGALGVGSVLIVSPALIHSTPTQFVSRTLGYQLGREASDSLWSVVPDTYAYHQAWLGTASRLVHALVLAGAGCLALVSTRVMIRHDVVGLAAISTAVLTGVIASDSYFSYNYLLWIAALLLPIIVLVGDPRTESGPALTQARRTAS